MAETMQDGIALYKRGNYTDALAIFLSIPTPNLNSPEHSNSGFELAYYIGLSYARLQRYDEALLYLEQVVTSDSSEKRANQCRLALAVIYSLTGRNSFADFELKKLLEIGYETAEVYSALAFVEWEQENITSTIENYEKALEINANSASALNGLGYVLACSGKDLTRALSLCKKAIEMKPDSPAFLDSLSWVYYKLGLLSEANMYIKRAYDKKDNKIPEIAEHYRIITEDYANNREQGRLASREENR